MSLRRELDRESKKENRRRKPDKDKTILEGIMTLEKDKSCFRKCNILLTQNR
jgi:hypothetical protein